MRADAFNLDDKRSENAKSSIPARIERFSHLEQETQRERTEQRFPAPKRKIVGSSYLLSIPVTKNIWADLHKLKTELRKILRSRKKCCETKVLTANRIYPSIGA